MGMSLEEMKKKGMMEGMMMKMKKKKVSGIRGWLPRRM